MNAILSFYLTRLFRSGNLRVTDADGRVRDFGDGSGDRVHMRFNDRASERAVALNPSLKLGECYMDGGLDILEGDMFALLRLVTLNAAETGANELWMRAIERLRLLARRLVQNNTAARARRNVERHYDLSDALYALFLDEDWQYSCAYFERPDASLDEAQLAKKRHVAAKLRLDRPGLRVLDIGCGWGGLALYLAEHADARVDAITLSPSQAAAAGRRAAEAGLADRARFAIKDYRAVAGTFDRIVSIGMFEHVGRDFYDKFFATAAERLAPDGVMLLHTIGRWQPPRNTNSFLAKYIFPGGYIPALSEVLPAIERADLMIADIEVLRLHYAETCRHWRERFAARRAEAEAMFDERFCRMWEFYLAASETAFRWQDLVVFQLQIVKRHGVVPITRAYLAEAEERLRALDGAAPRREAKAAE